MQVGKSCLVDFANGKKQTTSLRYGSSESLHLFPKINLVFSINKPLIKSNNFSFSFLIHSFISFPFSSSSSSSSNKQTMAAALCGVFRQSLPEVSARELHVLAVDDSHVDRKVIERLLKISSCKVTVVESGTRALQYLGLDGDNSDTSIAFEDSVKVNLIMTDYSMPGMTGFELLKKIKESSVFREIPVVVMSSENILTRIDSCLEEGAEEFLLKPVKLADVRRVTDFVMRGEGKEGGKRYQKRRRSEDCRSPSLSAELSPLSSKKSRL